MKALFFEKALLYAFSYQITNLIYMIISPLENTALLEDLKWLQVRPKITQRFGADFMQDGKWFYKSQGFKGHPGIDIRAKIGTKVFAPCDGKIKIGDNGNTGYGKYIKIRSYHGKREIVLAHLSEIQVNDGQLVNNGDLIGLSGDTGNVAPHLHIGLRFLEGGQGDIFTWNVKDYDNGYKGYVNIPKFITWKDYLIT